MIRSLPTGVGLGFKPRHLEAIQADAGAPSWFEVHPENYMGDGGLPHRQLTRLRQDFQLALHGVGMSLGSAAGVDETHLARLAGLVERYQPAVVSEHLAWSHWNSIFLNDLLPLPYTAEVLDILTTNIQRVQDRLGRTILIENPSLYLAYESNEMTEPELLNQLVDRTGCGLLCDINNIYVSCRNLGADPYAYLEQLNLEAVGEVHLAGHSLELFDDGSELRIDDHGSPVTEAVWELYAHLLGKTGGSLPTLIEWDTGVPDYPVLKAEAVKAEALLDRATTPDPVV